MARMVFGQWTTGSRHDTPRGGRAATHKRVGDMTACSRTARGLHALTNTTAPNGTELVDCTQCLRVMRSAAVQS